ncbi:unnamed protein product [Pylaiella littoralis]
MQTIACHSPWLAGRRGLCYAAMRSARRLSSTRTTAYGEAALPGMHHPDVRFASASSSSFSSAASSSAAEDLGPSYAVPKAAVPTLTVVGSHKRFPVRRVYCVGSNYREHALEMGGNPDKDPPFFFTKPPDAAVDVSADGAVVPYPPETRDLQHEVEMVVAIGRGGRSISPRDALHHVFAYGVGVDLTRRDMQRAAKKAGRPWDCSKGFDSSGPVGALTPVTEAGSGAVSAAAAAAAAAASFSSDEGARKIWLEVDGARRQDSLLGEMVWSVPEMIARLSELFALEAGDILFTGTPSAVAPLAIGEEVKAGVEGLEPCRFLVGPPLSPTEKITAEPVQ